MTNHLPEDHVAGKGRERWRRIAEAVAIVLAMAAPARAQDRNDTNDPPPLPRPTPAQVVGLRRLDRLARHLMDTPGATVEGWVRRDLSLPARRRMDLPMLVRHFAVPERDARSLFRRPGGREEIGWRAHIYIHWWDRYGDWSARGGTS